MTTLQELTRQFVKVRERTEDYLQTLAETEIPLSIEHLALLDEVQKIEKMLIAAIQARSV